MTFHLWSSNADECQNETDFVSKIAVNLFRLARPRLLLVGGEKMCADSINILAGKCNVFYLLQ
jgi:hypothetical protein